MSIKFEDTMPNNILKPDEVFFSNQGSNSVLTFDDAKNLTAKALKKMDDGELYLESEVAESLSFDDGVLKSANFSTSQGFGLRGVKGEVSAYASSSEVSYDALNNASEIVASLKEGKNSKLKLQNLSNKNSSLYKPTNPLDEFEFIKKLEVLKKIDGYIRSKNKLVKQVSVSLAGSFQVIKIYRPEMQGEDELNKNDIRPLVRLNISVVVEKNGRMERGSYGFGGRKSYSSYIEESAWMGAADEALRQALVNLESVPSPAGEMDVVLANGWPGVLLHEAVGHGLEGDFNRKKTSAFSNQMGKRVASKGVTVIDEGNIKDRRGSLNFDDEGTPTQKTVLIEDGILVGYLQDRLNARLMGMKPTGNGRRESFEHQPMPRMTNTYMLGGSAKREDLIKQVKNGIYAVNFGGGQVDITSGKFVFSATEAYKIENGKVTVPIKGATLIGNGPDVLKRVKGIANDMALDDGVGTCGKDGQSVPVGVGQPSMLIEKLTVGGTEVA